MTTLGELLTSAVQLHQSGQFRQAEQLYRQILQHDPSVADAWHLLGLVSGQLGNTPLAVECIQRAIQLQPAAGLYYVNLGEMLRRAGRTAEATACFERAIALSPGSHEAYNNLGLLHQEQGRWPEAEACYATAIRLGPQNCIPHNNLGALYKAQGRLDHAIRELETAVRLNPAYHEAYNNLGALHFICGRPGTAAEFLRRAIELRPDYAEPWNNLGTIYQLQENFAAAFGAFERAIALNPNYGDARVNLAIGLRDRGEFQAARDEFARAAALGPSDRIRIRTALVLPVIPSSVAEILTARSTLEQQVDALTGQKFEVPELCGDVGINHFYLAYHGLNDRTLQAKIAKLFQDGLPQLAYCAPHVASRQWAADHGRLRVGFISRFFHKHTIGKLHAGLIRHLARERFHVTLFRLTEGDDAWARRLNADADEVVVLPAHLEAAREQIARQQLDVLYFTDIGMEAMTYFLAFARLAPVQCTGWGHPVTTGIPTIDYFVSSELLEPRGAQQDYTERLLQLKTLPTCYERPQLSSPSKPRSAFGLNDDEHVYLCPQSLFKLHPDFDPLLAEILEADPRGRLVLIEGQQPRWSELLRKRLERSMPRAMSRVCFVPRQSTDDFLHLLAAADVILDPPQFSGGSTSLEALSLGVPIVTLPGASMRGRVTYGCYQLMGLTELVARDEQDYVQIALRLGTDGQYRARVRDDILRSAGVLFDNRASVRELEEFFLQAIAAARQACP